MRPMPIRRLLVAAVAAVLVVLVAAPAASAQTFRFFQSPSGAIGCVWEKSGSGESLRCDVYGATNSQPRKPSSCDQDYGPYFAMTARGRPRRICVGDAAKSPQPTADPVRQQPHLRRVQVHVAHDRDELQQPRRARLDAVQAAPVAALARASPVQHGQVERRPAARGRRATSIATIRPPATVKAIDRERPPVRRDDHAGDAVDQRRPDERRAASANVSARPATASAPRTITATSGRARRRRRAARRRGRARRRAPSKSPSRAAAKNASTTSRWRRRSASGAGGRALHPAAGPARELPRRGRRAVDDRRDLVERHARTCRAARTRAARPAPASRARPAARARPSRRAAPRARGRRRPRG